MTSPKSAFHIDYFPGGLPIILSVPHGGTIDDVTYPDREGPHVNNEPDYYTAELAQEITESFGRRTGLRPHMIVSRLTRTKVDLNRDLQLATLGNPNAIKSFNQYHGFIEEAREEVEKTFGMGLLIDVHGQSHRERWIEFGYLIKRHELKKSDHHLDHHYEESSFKSLAVASRGVIPFSDVIRGPSSLGGLMEAKGYKSVPSPQHPHPGDGNYFNGGHTTSTHGSNLGGAVDAVQVEAPREVRLGTHGKNRLVYAQDFADAVLEFFCTHYPNGRDFLGNLDESTFIHRRADAGESSA